MKITADFTKTVGQIRPLHGVGQPPMSLWSSTVSCHFHYLKEAGIPYSRLHDVSGRYGAGVYVDIPNIFRDFKADENDPANYDFRSTDNLIRNLKQYDIEPFYRLGVTIENDVETCAYRVFPPQDPAKWARICEHIIRHYNEGWAEGFTYGIKDWEIWNEPDSSIVPGFESYMWRGAKEEYYRLYEVTANHLKACFGDSIRVGGYGSCGFYAWQADPDGTGLNRPAETREEGFIQFFHEFLSYITSEEHKAPLDFFSWHSYGNIPETVEAERYCRKVLAHYGLDGVEDILDEWNPVTDQRRFTNYAASRTLGMMLALQKERMGRMNYYDASLGLMNGYNSHLGGMSYSGLFFSDTQKPTPAYFSFMAFNQLYRLKNEVFTASDCAEVYVGGATDGNRKVLLVVNTRPEAVEAEFSLTGADTVREILFIDSVYTYTPTGKQLENGKLTIPADSCVEIRF